VKFADKPEADGITNTGNGCSIIQEGLDNNIIEADWYLICTESNDQTH